MANPDQNRKKFLLIFGMSVIPFVIALVSGGKASFIKNTVNYGELITPVVTTERKDFMGYDSFSSDNIKELSGHWVLLNVVPQGSCEKICLDAVFKTKQLRLMMSKDLTRVRRAVLFVKDIQQDKVNSWFADDQVLLRVKPSEGLLGKISVIRHGAIPEGMLLLMDPLGNLMMQYEPGFDPYKVKQDLMHLLRISQIG